MALSLAATAALYAQQTGEILLPLVTLEHPDWAGPVRLVRNSESIISRGQTYTAYPFDVELPAVTRERVEPGRLLAANVSRELVPALRQVEGPIAVTLELVRAAAPDVVELSLPQLEIAAITADAAVIEAPLSLRDLTTQRYPEGQLSPATFPGLVA